MNSGAFILLQLAGAVAALLWGLTMLRAAVSKLMGWRLKRLAAGAKNGRLRVFSAGAVLGGCFQSSTAAILLGGSMAAQGGLTTAQGLALALGADVGATLAAQLLGFNLFALSPVLLLTAYAVNRVGKSDGARQTAHILFGLALIIAALRGIAVVTEPLRESETVLLVISAMAKEPALLVVLFAVLTALSHSSLAMALLTATLAENGLVDLPAAFWMIVGVNLGAGIPPLVAGLGEAIELRRITAGNALFRCAGALAMIPAAAPLAEWAQTLGASPAHMTVHFHTFINLAMSVPLLALSPAAGRWMERAMRSDSSGSELRRPKYLDPANAPSTARAIAAAIRETLNMGDLVSRMLEISERLTRGDNPALRAEIGELDDAVDGLNREIKLFTAHLEEGAMSKEETLRANLVLSTITHLEHIGDIMDHGIRSVTRRMRARRAQFSDEGLAEIRGIHGLVREDLSGTLGLLVSPDAESARHLHAIRLDIRRRCRQTFDNHLARLRRGRLESVETSSMHLDLVRDLKRVSDHISEMADSILTVLGGEKESAENPRPAAPPQN